MKKLLMPELALIDLDGTLVDSVPDLAQSIDQLMVELNLPERGIEAVTTWVGNGIEALVNRAITNDFNGKADKELFERAFDRYVDIYRQNNGVHSRLYDGVVEGLDYLQSKGCRIGCVTNKAKAFTRPLLQNMSIDQYFEIVVCGDDTAQKKPHPLPLLTASNHFGISPQKCWMIGDSINDVKAARAADFQIIAVSYGYNHGLDIRSHGPDAVIDSMAELSGLVYAASNA